MPWYQRTLPAQKALKRANAELVNARNTQDHRQALKFCDEAKKALERINISASTTDLDQIIAAYRDHGRVLEGLGVSVEAHLSYNKADELGGNADQGALASHSAPSTTQVLTSSPPSNDTANHDTGILPASIFAKDNPPPVIPCKLPQADERLADTRQLAYCLGILQASPSHRGVLDSPARTWLEAMEKNPEEQERLRTMATDLIRALVRDELKDTKAIAEVVCLAPVLEKGDFRILLSQFVDGLKNSTLLNIHALEGLAQMIQSAAPGFIDADDLVKILQNLNSRMQETHGQSLHHIYQLTLTVSRVLDAMADSDVKGLDRVDLHAPLLSYLESLKTNRDPYLVFQAAYAHQALLYVPDNETPWQATVRRGGIVVKGVSGLVSAVKGLNVVEFIEGLGNIQAGVEGAGQLFGLVEDAYKDVSALTESGQGLLESLKAGLSFSWKRAWYPALRGTDTLLQNGEVAKFKTLVSDAPCRRDLAFQWGVCQRLGNIAADSLWDIESRRGAVAFLGEIYRNDAVWGQNAQVKQYILDILLQLASTAGVAMQAEALLQELGNDRDTKKQVLYQACLKAGPSSHPLKVALPALPSTSSLLDRVQNKPSVEPDLRRYRRLRLQERGNAVYIPPQAKANRQATNDDLFDLSPKVKEFLGSDRKVLLLLGDSGAGKSTFNMELEWELWDAYMPYESRIPIFVALPAIDKPEEDLIAKQLRKYDFSESHILELKASREFVLICDGYDECQQKRNLYDSNQLNRPGQWKAQMVISCRSEYLGNDYRCLFLPGDDNDRTATAKFQEAVIAPFSKVKIQDYIEKYVEKYAFAKESHWDVDDYLRVIRQIPGLQELVKNPFLLTLSLEVLPHMVDPGENLSSVKITRVALYDKFVEQWVERGKRRLIKRELIGDDKKAFDILIDDGFTQNAIKFVKDLAVAIFEKQDGAPVVDYSSVRDSEKWQCTFFSQADDCKKLLREACPIIRIGRGSQYRFIHRSVLEYGLARAVFEPHSGGSVENTSAERPQSKGQGEEQKLSITSDSVSDFISPLAQRNYVNEPSILQFLAERVPQEPVFKQQLLDFIECSKMDKKWRIAAANAITILVRAGVHFNSANLKGIRIPGADLSGAQFDSADLQEADLSKINLRNIWLRQANLSNAKMAGVKFGECPYLTEDSWVTSCAYSPDGRTCAVGLVSGTISLYDTSTWVNPHTLHGHTGRIYNVVYSPSGHQIVSGSDDNTVRLWDTHTGAPGPILSGHTDSVRSVVYSPSGQQIASGSDDKTVRLWDAQTGAPGPILSGHTDSVRSVVYSPSGQQITSGSQDSMVRLRDTQTGAPGPILSGHTDYVHTVVYSPDGQQIVSGSWDKDDAVRLWDAQTGAPGPILSGHTGSVLIVVYSPSGQQIASGSDDNTVRLWDAQTGSPGPILSGHTNSVSSMVFSPNGQQIASGSRDKTVRLWDTKSGAPGPILSGHSQSVNTVVYSLSGQQIASGSNDSTVRLWDTQIDAPGSIFSGHTDRVNTGVYSPSGQQIASGSDDKTVRLWDTQTGAPGPILSGHTKSVHIVVYSPSGQQIASGSRDETVRLWDAQTGAPGPILSGHTERVTGVVYSPNGQQIASVSWDDTVRVWDAQTGAPVLILSGHTRAVFDVVYSPSGQQIASGSEDDTVRLWDAQTGAPGPILSGHTGSVLSVVYSPSGQQIASRIGDMTVRLWDGQTGAPGPILSGHTEWVNTVVYSPSGQQIASGSDDNTVRLWNTHTGAPSPILSGHTDSVRSVVYSPSGQHIASGSDDETVRLWDVNSCECLAIIEDYQGSIRSVAWKATLNGIYLATGCDDKSVRVWQVVKEEDDYQVRLHWSTIHEQLALSKSVIQNVQGLSEINIRLLEQRGAVGKPISP